MVESNDVEMTEVQDSTGQAGGTATEEVKKDPDLLTVEGNCQFWLFLTCV